MDPVRSTTPAPVAPRRPHTWSRPTGETPDPWAWLADRDDPETIAYLTAENDHATAWFDSRQGTVEQIFGEIRSRIQETDESAPVRHGDWWYTSRTIEGSNYAVRCRGTSRQTATEHVLLDENVEAAEHDFFELGGFEVSPDGHLLAWSSDTAGGEQYDLHIRDLRTGADLADVVTRTYYGLAWSADGGSVFYTVPDEAMRPHQVWRHRLGTGQADDQLVLEEDDERFHLTLEGSRDDRWIVICSESRTTTEVWVIPADDPSAAPVSIGGRHDDVEYRVEPWGDRFVIVTNADGAEDFELVTVPTDDPSAAPTTLVGHVPGRRILATDGFAGHLVISEWSQGQPRLRVLAADGGERVIDCGDEPCDVELDANPEYRTGTIRFTYQSLTTPLTVYEQDLLTDERTMLKRTPVPGVDLSCYESRRDWATAVDGTRVPLDIVWRRGTPHDGTAPALLYGYGSYEASVPPWFSAARLSLLDRGWVFALAHPRGGGEMGRRWYLDGKLLAKRNTFTDFIACAEHLVDGRIAGRVAIRGGSAGGLLVAAAMTMRPELFAAVVAEVPFVDVVNSMSDPSLPLTVGEWEEWGDPRGEPYAGYMLGYSPYDQVGHGVAYPAIYVSAGLNDPRVLFHEPAKWVARLRAEADITRPLVLRTEMGAGHGGPSGRYDAWRDEAHVLTFLLETVS